MSGWGCDPLNGALTAPDEVWNMEIMVRKLSTYCRIGYSKSENITGVFSKRCQHIGSAEIVF